MRAQTAPTRPADGRFLRLSDRDEAQRLTPIPEQQEVIRVVLELNPAAHSPRQMAQFVHEQLGLKMPHEAVGQPSEAGSAETA